MNRTINLMYIAGVVGIIVCCSGIFKGSGAAAEIHRYSYAVVISTTAYADAGWKTVADSLLKKHAKNGISQLVTWTSSVNDAKSALAAFKPDYIAFIARPAVECSATFVVAVSRMTRTLDNDPYGDAIWGIVTGYEAADALRAISESLTVKTVFAASGNLSYEPPIERFYQAIGMTCDSYTKTDYLFPGAGGAVVTENKRPGGEQDRIKIVASWLNSPKLSIDIAGKGTIADPVDCIITGGHGNVNLWQCHYPEAGNEGYMQSSAGKLSGAPASGNSIAINVPTPKIYWCASNCLMGNPNSKDNIVYAAFHTGHAVQMFGFVNNASAGDEFMAWGVYDRVTKNAGNYTLPQGFYLSNNNAQFELENPTGQMSAQQIRLFMDSTVMYGDPAADVRFYDVGDSARAYRSTVGYTKNSAGGADFTFTFTMLAHALEFGTGYCYQFRPMALLPVRIDTGTVAITGNEGHKAAITDNLVIWEMLAKGEKLAKGASKKLSFSAKITDEKTGAKNKPLLNVQNSSTLRLQLSGGKRPAIGIVNAPSGIVTIHITDLSGKRIRSLRHVSSGSVYQTCMIDGTLSSGTYMLQPSIDGKKLFPIVAVRQN